MSQRSAAVEHLDRTGVVHLATTTDDGREVVTLIWAVVVDGVPYIRNGHGAASKWYGRLTRSRAGAFLDGETRHRVRVEHATDETELAGVDAAYRAKYADDPDSLAFVVAPEARRHTLRVVPEG